MDCMSGNNVFVSYKYFDRDVEPQNNNYDTIARDYVNFMEKKFKTSKKYIIAEKKTITIFLIIVKKRYVNICRI